MIRRLTNVTSLLNKGKSILLLGPRGVGKTSLVRDALATTSESLSYNLLQGEVHRKFATHPELFRKEVEFQIKKLGKVTVVVDEVPRIPALLIEVHYLVPRP